MKTPDRITATAGDRHWLCARSLIDLARLLPIASIAAFCVAGVARAEPESYSGRWVAVWNSPSHQQMAPQSFLVALLTARRVAATALRFG